MHTELEKSTTLFTNMVRLKSSSHRINIDLLPENYLDAVASVLSRADVDPIDKLAFLSYMMASLHVNEIRDRLLIVEKNTVKHPSRELIRKKIVGMCQLIKEEYISQHGDSYVSPQYREDTMVPVISTYETSTAEPAAVIQYIHGEDDEQSKESHHDEEAQEFLAAFKATKSKGKSKGKRVGDPELTEAIALL